MSRTQRKPKTTAIAAPMTATIVLTTSPTRKHAMPIAKPIGQMLGGGTCGVSSVVAELNSGAPSRIQSSCLDAVSTT